MIEDGPECVGAMFSILDSFCWQADHSRHITPVASAQGAKPPAGGFCFLGRPA